MNPESLDFLEAIHNTKQYKKILALTKSMKTNVAWLKENKPSSKQIGITEDRIKTIEEFCRTSGDILANNALDWIDSIIKANKKSDDVFRLLSNVTKIINILDISPSILFINSDNIKFIMDNKKNLREVTPKAITEVDQYLTSFMFDNKRQPKDLKELREYVKNSK